MHKLLALGGLAVALCSHSACATLQVCNEIDETIFVAAGSEHNKAVTTLGWWEVPAGECKVINKGRVIVPTYVYGKTQPKQVAAGVYTIAEWGKDKVLVVGNNGEKFERENADKPQPGDDTAKFDDVTTELYGDVDTVTYAIRKGASAVLLQCKSGQKPTIRRAYPTKGYSCE